MWGSDVGPTSGGAGVAGRAVGVSGYGDDERDARPHGSGGSGKALGLAGGWEPLRLVVDRAVHAEEWARFEASVVRGPEADDCAVWASALGSDGYGRFWVYRGGMRIMVRANRYALAAAMNGRVFGAVGAGAARMQ